MNQREPSMDTSKPQKPREPASGRDRGRRRDDESPGEHVVDSLLPPGIPFDEAKDPGSQRPPRTPTDNRS